MTELRTSNFQRFFALRFNFADSIGLMFSVTGLDKMHGPHGPGREWPRTAPWRGGGHFPHCQTLLAARRRTRTKHCRPSFQNRLSELSKVRTQSLRTLNKFGHTSSELSKVRTCYSEFSKVRTCYSEFSKVRTLVLRTFESSDVGTPNFRKFGR